VATAIKIVTVTKKDLSEIAKLIQNSLQEVSSKYYPKKIIKNIAESYSQEALERKIKERYVFVARLVENRKIVGTLQLTKDGWICGLFIRVGYQKLGIGMKLVKKSESTCRKIGLKHIRAHVAVNSIEFYKKLGYKTVKKVELRKAGTVYRMVKKV